MLNFAQCLHNNVHAGGNFPGFIQKLYMVSYKKQCTISYYDPCMTSTKSYLNIAWKLEDLVYNLRERALCFI